MPRPKTAVPYFAGFEYVGDPEVAVAATVTRLVNHVLRQLDPERFGPDLPALPPSPPVHEGVRQ